MKPSLDVWLTVVGALQSCVPVVSLCAYIPQWRKLMKTRSSGSISITSWVLWAGAYSVGTTYSTLLLMATGKGWPLVITTAGGLGFVLFTLFLVWRYRNS